MSALIGTNNRSESAKIGVGFASPQLIDVVNMAVGFAAIAVNSSRTGSEIAANKCCEWR